VNSAPTENLVTGLSDNNKLTYFSPRFSGFQLGISYTPDDNESGGDGFGTGLHTDDDIGDQANFVSFGANFVESFNGFDVAVSGTYELGNLEADPANVFDDRESFHLGLVVGVSGFSFGGSYGEDNNGLNSSSDSTGYDIGATYSTGPWGVGLTYFHGEQDLGVASGSDEMDLIELGANYALGPGITIMGAISYYDAESQSFVDDGAGGLTAVPDSDGIAFTIGSKMSF